MMAKDDLRNSNREAQLEAMESWFRDNFEDPAMETPYVSQDGGYIWINGGPHDAMDELVAEFSGIVLNPVIEELADQLAGECPEWAPVRKESDYDKLLDDIARTSNYYQNFSDAISNIEKLSDTKVADSVSHCLLRLLYVNVITALETYLSDAFISTVLNDPKLMRRFIESTPEFQTEKIPLSKVFAAVDAAKQRARTYLVDLAWHHNARAKQMYGATLKIEFPADLGHILRAVNIRHDIVHRNGKSKDGRELFVTCKGITDLIRHVENFVQSIDDQLTQPAADSPVTLS
jgi:hypothetical protein